jgi:hypothetical protein
MSFFENFFQKEKQGESIILIDIGADGVAGAYVRYEGSEQPTLLYARRLPIEVRTDEVHERAMLRALNLLGQDLISEGAPILLRATGSGSATTILVSVDAPWQETLVRTENFEAAEPFLFTKNLVEKRLEETTHKSDEKLLVDESIISTTLNGYETHNPYGNKIHRASIIVLTSFIEEKVANNITTALRSLFHTTHILPITGSSLRYQALRILFPHEDEAIILDATANSLIAVGLVRKGVFALLVQVPIPSGKEWVLMVKEELGEVAKTYQLPRTIFLLAREPEILSLKETLDKADFSSLWLSDNPPKIVSVLQSHVSAMIRQTTASPVDIVLLLMALFWQKRRTSSEEVS